MEILQITLDEIFLVVGVIMISAALALAFGKESLSSGCASAYLGLGALRRSGYLSIPSDTMIFWAVAVMMVLVIRWMRVSRSKMPRLGRRYMEVGSLAGMMTGVAAGGLAAMSIGAIIGAMIGALAFGRTAAGASLGHGVWRAAFETGLPTVVLTSQIGLALNALF